MKPTLGPIPIDASVDSKPYLGQSLLLAAAQAILMLGYGAVLPILPYYLTEFGAGAFEYGLLVATFSIFAFIAAGPLDTLSDRIGHGTPMVLSGFVTAFGLFFVIISTSTLQFYLMAVFLGCVVR